MRLRSHKRTSRKDTEAPTVKAAGVLDIIKNNKALTALVVGGGALPFLSQAVRGSGNKMPDEEMAQIKDIFQKKYNLGKDFKLNVGDHASGFDPTTNSANVSPDVTPGELGHELGHAANYSAGDESLPAKLNRGATKQTYLWSHLAPIIGAAAGAGAGPLGADTSRLQSAGRGFGIGGLLPNVGRLAEEVRANVRGYKTLYENDKKPSFRDHLSSILDVGSYAAPVAVSALLAARGLKTGADKIPGGLADKKKPSDFNQEALRKGVKVELEHTSDHGIATEIAMDHLTEDLKYYNKLEKIEKKASLLERIKQAAARWSDEMAKGKINPADTERIKQSPDIGIRQLGKDPIESGAEKTVYPAFGGKGLGHQVSKRTYKELSPGADQKYMEMARAYPELMNPITKEHQGGGGWIEPKLSPLSGGTDYRYTMQNGHEVPQFSPEIGEALNRNIQRAGGKLRGLGQYGPDYKRNPVVEMPGGNMLYDIHPKNIGLTPEGDPRIFDAIVGREGEKRIPHADAKVVGKIPSPRKGLRTRIREGTTHQGGSVPAPMPKVKAKPPAPVKPKRPPIRRELPGMGPV